MRTKTFLSMTLTFGFLLSGSGANIYAQENPPDSVKVDKIIGTAGSTDQKFHLLAVNLNSRSFNYDGFHIGVEKSKQEVIFGSEKTAKYSEATKNCEIAIPGFKDIVDFNADDTDKLEEFICKRLDDGEAVFVTHILETSANFDGDDLYNLYRSEDDIITSQGRPLFKSDGIQKPLLIAGLDAIKVSLHEALSDKIDKAADEGNPYTHIIVMSTGWNNDQMDSLDSYNKWSSWIDADPNIRALYITFSWPSLWNDGVGLDRLSFRRKRNDADEVGLLPANILVNQVLSNQKYANQKLVLLGHSFGARILSRALFSGDLLEPMSRGENEIDVFIGLQPAFSMNRFFSDNSTQSEGYPYRRNNLGTRIFLTTSRKDESINWLQQMPHVHMLARDLSRERNFVLDEDGWELAQKHVNDNAHDANITLLNLDEYCRIPGTNINLGVSGEIFYLETSDCIEDHNDVFRQPHGDLIRTLLKSST